MQYGENSRCSEASTWSCVWGGGIRSFSKDTRGVGRAVEGNKESVDHERKKEVEKD